MFSGIQEILLIAAILLVILFIARMKAQRRLPVSRPPQLAHRLFFLSGRQRLALVVSLLWPLAAAMYFKPWQGSLEPFLYFGLGPVVLGWSITWIVAGFALRNKN